jgi:hypothetical protein
MMTAISKKIKPMTTKSGRAICSSLCRYRDQRREPPDLLQDLTRILSMTMLAFNGTKVTYECLESTITGPFMAARSSGEVWPGSGQW